MRLRLDDAVVSYITFAVAHDLPPIVASWSFHEAMSNPDLPTYDNHMQPPLGHSSRIV
jgi:hypothetical protein